LNSRFTPAYWGGFGYGDPGGGFNGGDVGGDSF
jgi:hypothetical protein